MNSCLFETPPNFVTIYMPIPPIGPLSYPHDKEGNPPLYVFDTFPKKREGTGGSGIDLGCPRPEVWAVERQVVECMRIVFPYLHLVGGYSCIVSQGSCAVSQPDSCTWWAEKE